VFALKSGWFFVRDLVLGFGQYPLDIFWHLGQGLTEQETDLFVDNGVGLRFATADGHGWTRTVEEQFHSPAYGVKQPHSTLRFAKRAQLPAEFVTLIATVSKAMSTRGTLARLTAASEKTSSVGYLYRSGVDEHSFIFGDGQPWKMGSWSSDAEVFYFGRFGDAPTFNLVCCNASCVDWKSRKILSAKKPVLRCELTGGEAVETVSNDPEAVTVDREAWRALVSAFPAPVKAT
jgi:hypothetical protein